MTRGSPLVELEVTEALMNGLYHLLIFCGVVGAGFCALSVYFFARAHSAIARLFVLLIMSSGLSFIFFALMRLPWASVPFLNWAGKVTYVILSFVLPNLWLATICLISSKHWDARRKLMVASLIYMLLGIVIAATNQYHDLLWNEALLATELINPFNGTISEPQKYFRHGSGIFVLLAPILSFTAERNFQGQQRQLVRWCSIVCLLPLIGFILAQTTVLLKPAWMLNSAFVYVTTFGVSSILITRKMLSGNILALAKEAHGLVVDQMESAVVVLDKSGLMIYRNAAADALFGQESSSDIVDFETMIERTFRVTYDQIGDSSCDYLVTDATDSVTQHFFEHSETPFTDQYGRETGVVFKFENRTKEVEAKNRMQQLVAEAESANQSKSAFVENMIQEIRAPMNGILGMTEQLSRTSLGEEQKRSLDIIHENEQSLLATINDILDFSKMESGATEMESNPFNLRQCAEKVVEDFISESSEKGIAMVCDLDPKLADRYLGDVARLRQVLINLVRNAVKFTDQGRVVLSVEILGELEGKQRLRLKVTDTGIGIPEDRINSLFTSFSQLDESVMRKEGGTGLGLAISNSIVELMGGKMWVESESGVGSSFAFDLQLEVTS